MVGGDELIGLGRGLLYAGRRSVLLTLWDVNDQSTAEFMRLFYEGLASGKNKARAVQSRHGNIRRADPTRSIGRRSCSSAATISR